jgi:protein-tyrosine-phosphatase/tRNA A37 threonylcarbamoyladenosine synthetase subunit TsaC/SUA5/YrdC
LSLPFDKKKTAVQPVDLIGCGSFRDDVSRMASMLPWQPEETCRQVLAHLAKGECVALPTESTYVLVGSALHPSTVERLACGGAELALSDVAQVADWLPLLRGAGARLVHKLGAGPYTLSVDAGFRFGLFQRLPKAVQRLLSPSGKIAVRLPAHPIWRELRRVDQPLISVSISGADEASKVASLISDRAACVVDAGPTTFAVPPSLVQVEGRRCSLSREGGLTREQLDEFTLCRILFVCTGNTCRSPMAEALCKKLLADRLGCAVADLQQHGFCVQSAGLAATMGSEASEEAVQVASTRGADLSAHRSCPATLDMLQWADFVFAMTAGHWHALRGVNVPGLTVPEMLSPNYEDIADPIGRALIDYQTCAEQILDCLKQRLPQILEA